MNNGVANRPSEPHREFVKTSDGSIVKNRAYKGPAQRKQAVSESKHLSYEMLIGKPDRTNADEEIIDELAENVDDVFFENGLTEGILSDDRNVFVKDFAEFTKIEPGEDGGLTITSANDTGNLTEIKMPASDEDDIIRAAIDGKIDRYDLEDVVSAYADKSGDSISEYTATATAAILESSIASYAEEFGHDTVGFRKDAVKRAMSIGDE